MVLAAEGASQSSTWMPALMLIAAIAVMLFTLRRRMRRSASRPSPGRDQLDAIRARREARESVDGLMLDLEEFVRKASAQLDTKFVKLECVIRDADERIRKLEALEAAQKQSAKSAAAPAPAIKSSQATAAQQQQPTPKPKAPATPAATPTPVDGKLSKSDQVFQLADRGLSAIRIAEELRMPLGEVELFLRLRPE